MTNITDGDDEIARKIGKCYIDNQAKAKANTEEELKQIKELEKNVIMKVNTFILRWKNVER